MKKVITSSFVLGTIVTIAASYAFAEGKHEGGHGHEGPHWASPKDADARVNPVKSDAASIERGKQMFMANCTSCHGTTAKGDGPLGTSLNPKPTNLTIMAGNHSDGDFEWKIANGRGAMPGWKSSLSQNQRWDLVNYIQALENPNGKGNMAGMDHSKLSEEEMKAMQEMMDGSSSDTNNKTKKVDDHSNHDHKKHSHSH